MHSSVCESHFCEIMSIKAAPDGKLFASTDSLVPIPHTWKPLNIIYRLIWSLGKKNTGTKI